MKGVIQASFTTLSGAGSSANDADSRGKIGVGAVRCEATGADGCFAPDFGAGFLRFVVVDVVVVDGAGTGSE